MTSTCAARVALELEAGHTRPDGDVLKKQFRKMCFKYHPDRCRDPTINANDMFNSIREAYNYLIGKSRSFAIKRRPAQVHEEPPKPTKPTKPPKPTKSCRRPPPQSSSSPAPSSAAGSKSQSGSSSNSKGTRRKVIAKAKQSTVADENLMSFLGAIGMLGLDTARLSGGGECESYIEAAYRRSVLKLYVKYKDKEEDISVRWTYDRALEHASIAYERILLSINFEKYWAPPYSRNLRRMAQKGQEDGIIAEYVQRQMFLEKQQELQKEKEGEAKQKDADNNERCCKQTPEQERVQAAERAKRALEIGKTYGAMYSNEHGKRHAEQQEQQRQRQIDQQCAAQEQHATDYNNLLLLCHCCFVKSGTQGRGGKRKANGDDGNGDNVHAKRPRVAVAMKGASTKTKAKVKVASGQNGDPIVIVDESDDSDDGDDDDDEPSLPNATTTTTTTTTTIANEREARPLERGSDVNSATA